MTHFGEFIYFKFGSRLARGRIKPGPNIINGSGEYLNCTSSLSTFNSSPLIGSLPNPLLYTYVRFVSYQPKQTMSTSWQDEKKRYFQMPLHDKRKDYYCGDKFITLEDLMTWDEYVLKKKYPPKKSPMPADFVINATKNSKLCKKISVFRGDITTLEVDAVVNAANKSLLGGGGVDGAINNAAGKFLLAENRTHGGCNVGEVKVSGGYQLPAKFVLSTVGPQGEKPDLLRKCYKNAMETMVKLNLKTIAFPSISTGIYGYPVQPAAHVSAQEIRKALEAHEDKIDRVIFCIFSEVDEEIYSQVLVTYFPLGNSN